MQVVQKKRNVNTTENITENTTENTSYKVGALTLCWQISYLSKFVRDGGAQKPETIRFKMFAGEDSTWTRSSCWTA
jgi:hypothetical protein